MLVLTGTLLLLPALFAQQPPRGIWEGSLNIASQQLTLIVNFKDDTTAMMDIIQQNAVGLKLINVRYSSPNIHFELAAGPGLATFDGTASRDLINGSFKQAGATGTFELRPQSSMRPQSREEAPAAFRPLLDKWNGDISIMGQVLAIIVEFRSVSNALTGTIDIPAQSAKGLPLKNIICDSSRAHFELPAGPGLAIFDGVLKKDTLKGSFQQSGIHGTFWLARGERATKEVVAEEPPPYKQEEVGFRDDSIKFSGTLTIPHKSGRHPAVVMITGSGPQNRDEELFGFKPFKMIADHFTRNGIAVLRYDDRGVGGSTGNTSTSTTSDFANDVVAAVKYLQTRSDINPAQIGLCGHSEGGIVGPLAATRDQSIAFVILMSGTGLNGAEIVSAQAALIAKADGTPDADIRKNEDMNRRLFTALREGQDLEQFRKELTDLGRRQLDKMKPEERKTILNPDEYLESQINGQLARLKDPWFRYFLSYEPAPTLALVRCPVLALFGELDLQVPAEINKEAIEKALRKGNNKDFLTKVFPKANHLFLTAKTGSPSEYGTLKKEFVPGFLETMTEWILRRVTALK
jgi:hypothetical protein